MYDSMTGNTEKLAKAFAEGVEKVNGRGKVFAL